MERAQKTVLKKNNVVPFSLIILWIQIENPGMKDSNKNLFTLKLIVYLIFV